MSMEEILASIRRYVSDETPEITQDSIEYVSGKTADVIRLTEALDDRSAGTFTPPQETHIPEPPKVIHMPQHGFSSQQQPYSQAYQPPLSSQQQQTYPQQATGYPPAASEPYFTPIQQPTQPVTQPIYESTTPIQPPVGIFSEPTLHTTEKAFSKLTQAFQYAQEEKRSAKEQSSIYGSSAIESFVIEMARPMIRQWVDQNLPQLVDRLVTQEIEKLTNDLRKKLL